MVAATGLLLAACSSDGGAESTDATVPRGSSTTSTSIDVSTVPDTITVEYAQAVMDELDRLLGDAIRELVAAGVPSDKFVATLKAVYDEPQYAEAESLYGEDAARKLEGYRRPPGDPTTKVEHVVDSSGRCMVLRATRSFEAAVSSDTPGPALLQLFLKKTSRDPESLNHTAWALVADRTGDAGIPENPCA